MVSKRTLLLSLVFLIPLSVMLTECYNNKKEDARGQVFAGSATCISCHKDVYNSYIHTAHFETSRPAALETIHGSFAKGHNVFSFGNGMSVTMEKRKDGLYQAGYEHGKPTTAQKFDITIGGVKAETYLYWKGNKLFELPMSYFSALHSWTNSPGYDTGQINFTRPIVRRCMECHSSYINELPNPNLSLTNRTVEFDKSSLIYGIDCERCHGPAANHVNFHTQFPGVKQAKYITTYNALTRQQKLDACAVCHSGNKDVFIRSAFVFKQGDTLAKFKEHNFAPQNTNPATLDVHGNQNGLLASSKCFVMSNMNCNTCHNVHTKESGNLVLYSQRCMSCHTTANHNVCKLLPKLGDVIKKNCIDCHMPAKSSNMIQVEANGSELKVPYLVRTHRIAIYPQETKKIMAFINSQN
jgi:nitrate/TMAO reductase-like tetraheme cytochrome c subunit